VDFLDVPVDAAIVESVQCLCSVDNAADLCSDYRHQIEEGVRAVRGRDPGRAAALLQELRMDRLFDPNWLLLANHVSSTCGAPGTWVVRLQQTEVEVITERYGSWLRENGYPV